MKYLGSALVAAVCLSWAVQPGQSYPLDYYFETKLDHVAASQDNRTFMMRYVVEDKFYNDPVNVNKSRPILFYAGNEGDIYSFYNNSGFMTKTLAEQFGALIVFAEHRYFGQSFPFDRSVAFTAPYNTYLTVENTLEDYIQLLKTVKMTWGAEDKAVIAFGGSYGGMLAAWIRMRYPAEIQGALAASAPLVYFQGAKTAASGDFSEIVTADFNNTYEDGRCAKGIKEGFTYLMDLKTRDADWAELGEVFSVCEPFKSADDIQNLYYYLGNGLNYMAMTDYPYPSSFLQPMPAWPITEACKAFADVAPQEPEPKNGSLGALSEREKTVLTALKSLSDVYFNYTNATECTNYNDTEASGSLDAEGWNVLACNQLAMPIDFGSADSMFITELFNETQYAEDCFTKYGLNPYYSWALDQFGGADFQKDFYDYSNIIFSNGELDPWRAGGVYKFVQFDLPFYVIRGGAHHLDLREPMPEDKETNVGWVRDQETQLIEQWINEYQSRVAAEKITFVQ
uniref:Lysosomal Pro-X carboxypeptidase n=1 Tax=Strombidium rassoulzadegani TaxID=1082188 RepID=A0A7S3FTN2_9SPIT|mmetsp:Transcript_11133/g.18683  ORF Transcript_11133/g.18683 Transcript_11133/m.18683 type:complete len:511 (+) Transcript_11133:52-1584(+)